MKTALKTFALCITCFFAAQPTMRSEERAIGYSCGEAAKTLEILIVEVDGKTPVANATVTFFDEIEIHLMRQIEENKRAGLSDSPSRQPIGVTATTGADGKTSLKCKVDWHEALLADGSKTETISPRGQLRIECEGYRTRTLEVRSLFRQKSCEAASPLPPVSVPLKKGITRPPLPENVTVSKIDLVIPDKESDASIMLSDNFFNKPDEYIFDEATSDYWREKWQEFSASLISKAKKSGLDAASLERCLKALMIRWEDETKPEKRERRTNATSGKIAGRQYRDAGASRKAP